ncbi:hypothetical protein FN976_19385 [Caenimonas sedimenti]|uniref:Uncharacterized protein n=1 Tax=Caenimonas sedimenti TaxID=2596921 RepID=A0A562ZLJ8_9BURK|nr:hypothetical protein [Caenimonas sedimenti]TWO69452.1 hypothetical protein FN976_19385 [Caenimonas sedimenti]
MAFTVSSASRRLVMAVLLSLATVGAIIRYFAPNPSTLRDVGTLLLVLWLPAVGNFVAYLIRKVPRGAPPPLDFDEGSVFTAQLTAQVESVPVPAGFAASVSDTGGRCTLVVGRRGFSARLAEPLASVLARADNPSLPIELLRPAAGLPHLAPGTDFHVLLGNQAVAKGRVVSHTRP